MVRRFRLPSMVALVVASSGVVAAFPAAAAVTSTVDEGVLTVTGDAESDLIVVGCSDQGEVTVTGQDPGSGPAACASITSIVVTAGEGNDTVDLHQVDVGSFATLQTVSIDAGDADDSIRGSLVADTIEAGAGGDVVRADPSAGDVLDGGGGSDQMQSAVSSDLTISDDEVTGASGTVMFTSFEVVVIRGSTGDEEIDARDFSGWLTVVAGGGNDRVVCGSGPNSLFGGAGDDVLVGGPAGDGLYGRVGDDIVIGKGGRDSLQDEGGADRVSGGAGRDTFYLFGIGGQRGNVFRGGQGADYLSVDLLGRSATLTDRSFAARGASASLRSIEVASLLVASTEECRIDGTGFSGNLGVGDPGSGDDVILGGSGDDGLFGGDGDDVISGGPGRDNLHGGEGTDRCDGGPVDRQGSRLRVAARRPLTCEGLSEVPLRTGTG